MVSLLIVMEIAVEQLLLIVQELVVVLLLLVVVIVYVVLQLRMIPAVYVEVIIQHALMLLLPCLFQSTLKEHLIINILKVFLEWDGTRSYGLIPKIYYKRDTAISFIHMK